MSKPAVTITGASLKVYINNSVYNEAQSVSYTIDYGEVPIYGIDTPFPQEITSTRAMVSGSISGIRIRNSGGIEAYNARSKILEMAKSQYVSLRIYDRSTGEDILYVPNAKITKQSFQAAAQGTAKLSFDFIGQVAFEPSDREA